MEKVKCVSCKEEINVEAKKCPHCHGWQTKWGLDFQNPKYLIIYMVVIFFVVIPLFVILMSNVEDYLKNAKAKSSVPEPSYKSLKISESSLETYNCGDTKCIAVFGVIENESDYMWTNIYYHAELFNKNNQMIDVLSEKEYDIVVPARSSTSFRVSRGAVKDLAEYADHKISIRMAIRIKD